MTKYVTFILFGICVLLQMSSAQNSSAQQTGATSEVVQTNMNLGKIMPLGDSITKGAPAGAYRAPLFTLLKKGGYTFTFVGTLTENPTRELTEAGQDHHQGHSGMGMDWIRGHLKTFFATNQPNYILLVIGANDVGGATVPQLKERMDKLLTEIFTLQPTVKLYLASITPQKRSAMETIKEFNKLIPGIVADHASKQRSVTFVSMDALDLKDLEDSVHPNVSGSLKIAQAFYTALVAGMGNAPAAAK